MLLKLRLGTAVLLLALVAACGGDEFHAGMSEDEAGRIVHARAQRSMPSQTFPYPAEAVKSKAPRGVNAWLVKVDFDSHSGTVCAYAWRDKRGKTHVQWDGTCRRWDF